MLRSTKTATRTNSKFSSSRPSDPELHKLIEKKAYELFEKRGRSHGNAWADWLEAERLVKRQYSVK